MGARSVAKAPTLMVRTSWYGESEVARGPMPYMIYVKRSEGNIEARRGVRFAQWGLMRRMTARSDRGRLKSAIFEQ